MKSSDLPLFAGYRMEIDGPVLTVARIEDSLELDIYGSL